MLYKIGDFSKKTGISIRTLRYYDSINLFEPAEIDLFTGYRYYSEEQIEDIKIINELKDAGFSLDEIKKYWNNFNDQIMNEKKSQLLMEIENINQKIRKVDYLRANINKGKIILNKKIEERNKIKTLF